MTEIDSSKYRRDTVSVGINNVLLILLSIAYSIAIARVLGPTNQGLVALIMLVPMLLSKTISFGTQAAASYFINSKKHSAQEVSSTVVTWSVLASLLVGLIVIFFYNPSYLSASSRGLKLPLFIGAYFIVNFIRTNIVGLFYALEDYRLANRYNLINDLIPALAALVLWPLGLLTVSSVLLAFLVSALIGCVFATISLNKSVGFRLTLNPSLIKAFFLYGLPVYYNSVINLLQQRIAYFFLAASSGLTAVGYYTVAYAVAEKLGELAKPFVVTHFPKTIQLQTSSPQEAASFTAGVFSKLSAAFIILGLPYAFATYCLLPVFYSESYRPSILPAIILSAGIALWGLVRILNNLFAATRNQTVNAYFLTIGLLTNIVLLYIFQVTGSSVSLIALSMPVALLLILLMQLLYWRTRSVSLLSFLPSFSAFFSSAKRVLKK